MPILTIKKAAPYWKQPHSKLPVQLPLNSFYRYGVVVSEGIEGIDPVVSTGVDILVSEGIDIMVSPIGAELMSEPVEFSGVSQAATDIAKKAMKRMLFM